MRIGKLKIKRPRADRRAYVSALIAFVSGVLMLIVCGAGNIDIYSLLLKISLLGSVCVGAVFVFTVGAFGISLGASTLLSLVCGAVVLYYSSSLFVSACACICVSALGCVLSALMSYSFSLPPYVTAMVMLTLFVSAARGILELFGGELRFDTSMSVPYASFVSLCVFSAFFISCFILYNVSPLGKKQKRLGSKREIANLCGIGTRAYSTLGYLIAGIGVGICASFILCTRQSITGASVSDLGFNIIFAVVLGLVFLTGNGSNRLFYALCGSISAVFIGEIFSHILKEDGRSAPLSQMFRTIILISVLIISKNTKEEKNR